MQTLTRIPRRFRAGTTVKYTRTHPDFPASDGWTLQLELRGKSTLSVTATGIGAGYELTLSAAATALAQPGTYVWLERYSKGGEVHDGESGPVEILVNIATAGAGELQPWQEKAVEALRASILGAATADQEQFQIQGQMVARYSLAEKRALLHDLEEQLRIQRTGRTITTRRISLRSGR